MKIIILHGDSTVQSEKRLFEYITKSQSDNVKVNDLRGRKDSSDLGAYIRSQSLFDEKRLIIISESDLSSNLKVLSKIKDKSSDVLVIYAIRELPKTLTNKFPDIFIWFLWTFISTGKA